MIKPAIPLTPRAVALLAVLIEKECGHGKSGTNNSWVER